MQRGKNKTHQFCHPLMQFVVKHCHFILPLYQFFSQFSQKSPQSPTFIHKFLNKFPLTFKNAQIFYQNLTFITVTHVYTKVSSATKHRAFGI